MADWPDANELKQVVDVTGDDWDTTLDRVMASAIDRVKADVGNWDEEIDVPDERLAQAALRMAELIASRPDASPETIHDTTYRRLLFGHRRKFGIA